MQSIKRE